MAKYNVRGLSILNHKKNMLEALNIAESDDDITWNGKETELGLHVNEPLRIIGTSGAKMKVPEHKVGMFFSGTGAGLLKNVKFSCKEISNNINIRKWEGTLTFKNIISEYSTRHREKAYASFVGNDLSGATINLFESTITNPSLKFANNIILNNTIIQESGLFNADNLKCTDSQLLGTQALSAKSINLKNTLLENASLEASKDSHIDDSTINGDVSVSGQFIINNLSIDNRLGTPTITLKNGNITIFNSDLSNINLILDNTELIIKGNVQMPDKSKIKIISSRISNQNGTLQTSQSFNELNSMIGLDNAKKVVKGYINLAKVSYARSHQGLNDMDLSLHMVFEGSPGTGKTTVAEILGRLMFEEGIMPTSKFVHVGRKDLIGTVVGESEELTNKAIQSAKGGILFIDEAYSLLSGGDSDGTDYGVKVVDLLTDEVEKKHNELIVILAGYTDKMHEFFHAANPGLKSRFSTFVNFPDYSLNELYEIAKHKLDDENFTTDKETDEYIFTALKYFYNAKCVNGNGRFVRNFLQKIKMAQSNRITKNNTLDAKSLSTIIPQDVQSGYTELATQIQENKY